MGAVVDSDLYLGRHGSLAFVRGMQRNEWVAMRMRRTSISDSDRAVSKPGAVAQGQQCLIVRSHEDVQKPEKETEFTVLAFALGLMYYIE